MQCSNSYIKTKAITWCWTRKPSEDDLTNPKKNPFPVHTCQPFTGDTQGGHPRLGMWSRWGWGVRRSRWRRRWGRWFPGIWHHFRFCRWRCFSKDHGFPGIKPWEWGGVVQASGAVMPVMPVMILVHQVLTPSMTGFSSYNECWVRWGSSKLQRLLYQLHKSLHFVLAEGKFSKLKQLRTKVSGT